MTDTTGAVLQRDGKTYAIATRIPAGIISPGQLEMIAGAGRKYDVPILKITSGQRIVFAGLLKEDVPRILADLGPLAKPESAPCVKFVQACLGTDWCRYGTQDSIGLARTLDEAFRDLTFPAKIKIGVSGCPRCCSESHTRDIGVVGTPGGWSVFFGGNAGTRPRFGDLIARDLSASEAVDCAVRLAGYYRDHARQHERTARFMERTGMDVLRSDLLSLLPYIPLENAR
jgi:NAD(P)H-nitrite reductase large subunit